MPHTPGPWTVGSDAARGGLIPIHGADGRYVAAVANDPQGRLDAALIVEAPTLLAALVALDPYLDHIPGGIGGLVDDARQAIEAARGE